MKKEQELLAGLIRNSLTDAGLDADEQTLAILSKTISITGADGNELVTRTVYGELESDGKVGKTIHRHQNNLLNLDLGEWIAIVSKTIPLTAAGLYASSTPWQKVAVAFSGIFTTLWAKSKEQLSSSDAEVLFAIAKVDKLHATKEEITASYTALFGKELTTDHLKKSLGKLENRGIVSSRGNAVTTKERLALKF
jgi:hypothetical protein